jgi:uncharacterized membrane protein
MHAATTTRPSFLATRWAETHAGASKPGVILPFHWHDDRRRRPALHPGPPAGTRLGFGDDAPGDDRESPAESETGRLEAFSDCVLAVIITIMAFELKAPADGSFTSLRDRFPALLVYLLSFVFIGIYWNNHHHLLRATRRVTAGVMWANLHLLFWLSLIPVLTGWIGAQYGQSAPAATYGMVCLGAALAFMVLVKAIIHADGSGSLVTAATGRNVKPGASLVFYAAAGGLAFVSPWISYALFAAVAALWFVPFRRLSR